MLDLTSNRIKYHEFQERFKKYLTKGCLIYDIGRSDIHDYKETFKDYKYITIDRLKSKNPDLVEDFEGSVFLDQADAVILNGVTEQCDNPFKIFHNIHLILKKGGVALFGIISVGCPLYTWDYLRFTPNGVKHLLKDYKILEEEIVYRGDMPDYIFKIVQKI
jgi:SAM-dependent methyltransferase